VCRANTFSTTTRNCGVDTLATSTTPVFPNASTSVTLPGVLADGNYNAWGFIVDEHGHAAVGGAQATNQPYTVSNVAPTVPTGQISVNNGTNITLTTQAGQTASYTLSFLISDANSCRNITDTANEITGFTASVFRSGLGTSTCDGTPGSYNPNNCYPSTLATSTWNLVCTASSTSCTGPGDPDQLFNCTFPLWYVAEPTDEPTYATAFGQTWTAAIQGIDNNNATGTKAIAATGVGLISYTAINLLTAEIPFGALEPGNNTGTLRASTTAQAVGNTGINQNLSGQAMCPGFTSLVPCPVSASSTVPVGEQEFGTSTLSYGSGRDLASTTQLLEIRIPKSTSTSTPANRATYWGINVPGTITVAGAYTGLNTFAAVTSNGANW
jgi:hypothetical protein